VSAPPTAVTRAIEPNAAKTILICEDDPNLRTLVRVALGEDYRFLEAPDGNVATELLHAARPDLIVLDLMLPGRSGFDLLEEIRHAARLEDTPVVVISAWAHADAAAVAAGADRFVSKPFDPNELHATVADLLERADDDR
jgi:DNA-binding response OmpR family regulator